MINRSRLGMILAMGAASMAATARPAEQVLVVGDDVISPRPKPAPRPMSPREKTPHDIARLERAEAKRRRKAKRHG